MPDAGGLSAVHADVLERIARRVERSSAAGRYFAVGAAADMRSRVVAALRGQLGAERVIAVDLSGSTEDPWTVLRARHLAGGQAARGTLYVAHGLRALRAAAGGRSPYQQLNLARDAWGGAGLHVLVWLEGLAELDAFLGDAADLWSLRDAVGWFLTRADFLPDGPAPEGSDPFSARIAAAEATLARQDATAVERVIAAAELAECLEDQGRPWAAWDAVGLAVRWEGRVDPTQPEAARASWLLAMARARVLIAVGRPRDGVRVGEQLKHLRHLRLPAWATQHAELVASRGLPDEEEVAALRGLSATAEGANRALALDNLALALARLGCVREAAATLDRAGEGLGEALRRRTLGGIAYRRGERTFALRSYEAAAPQLAAGGYRRLAAASRRSAAALLEDLGLVGEADALLDEEPDEDPLARFYTTAQLCRLHWRTSGADLARHLSALVAQAAELAPQWAARATVAFGVEYLLAALDDEAAPDDPILATLERILRDTRRAARDDRAHGRDPEVVGACDWSLSVIAQIRGDRAGAWALADGGIVAWARSWRGRVAEVAAWRHLAEVAPTANRALDLASRAVSLADTLPSLLARIAARETLAAVHARVGDIASAAVHLTEALTLAQQEGLRDEELSVLHALAELPGHPGARDAASESLVLAGALMLPREEARALLNLALLDAPERRSADRRLTRARALADALGPPRLRARLAAIEPPSAP